MPYIQIYSKENGDSEQISSLLAQARAAGAAALGCGPENLWVDYIRVTKTSHPPVVRILALEGRAESTRLRLVKAVAESVSRALDIAPERVWIHYEIARHADVWHERGFES